jgi:hypothetical protein
LQHHLLALIGEPGVYAFQQRRKQQVRTVLDFTSL